MAINKIVSKTLVVATMIATFFFVYPLLSLFLSWGDVSSELWTHLLETTLPSVFLNTIALIFIVVPCALFLGGGLALLCFFGSVNKIFIFLLCLPLALPKYVVAFVYLSITDYSGPLQSSMRQYGLDLSSYFQTGQVGPPAFVFTTCLYPYVFLAVLEGLRSIDEEIFDSAALFGVSRTKLIKDFVIPQIRPWVLAGSTLVALECVSDFGAVAIFNYDTLTTSIYKSWFGLFSIATATQLSSVLAFFALIALIFIRKNETGRDMYRGLSAVSTRSLSSFCFKGEWYYFIILAVLCFTTIIPLIQMISISTGASIDFAQIIKLSSDTFMFAFGTSCLSILMVFLLRYQTNYFPNKRFLSEIPKIGFAVPGVVIAVCSIYLLEHFSALGFLRGMVIFTVFSLSLKFYSLAAEGIEASFSRVPKEQEEAARLVGASSFRLFFDILRPYISKATFIAFALVFIDAAKEMPIVLMTRSLGRDTLSIKIFEYTSEGRFSEAVFPSIVLCFISVLPLFFYVFLNDSRSKSHVL